MGLEMSSIWEAMKGSQYQRTMDQLDAQVSMATDLNDALTIALNRVVLVAHAVAGTCWGHDRFGDGRIRPKAVYGGANLGNISLAPGEGIAGQVIEKGKSVIIPDCQKDPRWAGKVDAKTGFQTKTMICVPLRFREYTFGCIQIINKTDDLAYDEKDLLFAENLATRASQLFERYHLLDQYAEASEIQPVQVMEEEKERSFTQLLSAETFAEVEEELLHTQRISQLSETQQKHVLRLSREIWMILKNNPEQVQKGAPKKGGFWKR